MCFSGFIEPTKSEIFYKILVFQFVIDCSALIEGKYWSKTMLCIQTNTKKIWFEILGAIH